MNTSFPIVVLISGNGSNLQAIIDAIVKKNYPIEIKAVISNKATAVGLQRATAAGIPTEVLLPKNHANRVAYDQALIKHVDRYQAKLIVLAGFMRVLSAEFVNHFNNKLINIHPSLLPKHKGLNTHQRVLEAGDTKHGCSIHFVSNELDSGKIIAQQECNVNATDTVTSLNEKIHQLEHQLYPDVIRQFAIGELLCD